MGREKRAEERDSRQMIRNVANDILDDMVGCGGCAVTWEKVRVQESYGNLWNHQQCAGGAQDWKYTPTKQTSTQNRRPKTVVRGKKGLWC